MVDNRRQLLRVIVTFVALLVLATLSLLLAVIAKSGGGIVAALAIAAIKVTAVLLFFMDLAERRLATAMTVLVSVALLALLVGLAATDVATRHTFPARPEVPAGAQRYVR